MRQLSLQEISSVSGAEKALSQMTPTDFLPYAAAYLGATFLGSRASTWTHAYLTEKEFAGTISEAFGYVVGAVGSYFAVDQANKRVIQKLV